MRVRIVVEGSPMGPLQEREVFVSVTEPPGGSDRPLADHNIAAIMLAAQTALDRLPRALHRKADFYDQLRSPPEGEESDG